MTKNEIEKMSKRRIIQECQRLANEYLRVDDIYLSGRNKSKKFWINRLLAYQEMVNLNKKAQEILSKYSNESIIFHTLSGNMPDDLIHALELRQQANEIWMTN